jgi:hypothetical protein
MDAGEPRPRHRGFFLHSSDGESDGGELENPEGFIVRVRFPHNSFTRTAAARRRRGVSGIRFGGRSHRTEARVSEGQPAIRSGSVTGSRQRAGLPR